MTKSLLCPMCDEWIPVVSITPYEQKRITIYTAVCECCHQVLFTADGVRAERFTLNGALKAEHYDSLEDNLIIL